MLWDVLYHAAAGALVGLLVLGGLYAASRVQAWREGPQPPSPPPVPRTETRVLHTDTPPTEFWNLDRCVNLAPLFGNPPGTVLLQDWHVDWNADGYRYTFTLLFGNWDAPAADLAALADAEVEAAPEPLTTDALRELCRGAGTDGAVEFTNEGGWRKV